MRVSETAAAVTAGSGAPPVVVGVDGSAPSRAALRWAYRYADLTGSPLELVIAWTQGASESGPMATEAYVAAQESIAAALPDGHRDVPIRAVPGRPDDVLLDRGESAALLVVGPHGRHLARERVLGVTSAHLLAGASCPVAVVHVDAERTPWRQRIVVGVDGSASGQAALAWAARLARLTDAKVDAITTWRGDTAPGDGRAGIENAHESRAEATLMLGVLALPDHLRTVVRSEVIRGRPAEVLLDAGRTADMIVIGDSRGGHYLTHLLGSVSREVVLHATVPVVATHSPAR